MPDYCPHIQDTVALSASSIRTSLLREQALLGLTPCVVVAHPLSNKTGSDKKAILSNLRLWNLPVSEESK